MPVLKRNRAIAMLTAGAIVVGALIFVARLQAGTDCSIAWMANDFGLELSSSSAMTQTETQAFTTEVLKQFPSATIEETERAAVKSSRLPPVSGHEVSLLRLGNLPPEAVGAPAGQQPLALDVSCAMSIYDSGTGAFIVTLKAYGNPANATPAN